MAARRALRAVSRWCRGASQSATRNAHPLRREMRLRRRPHPAASSRIKRQNPLPPFRLQRVLRNLRQLPKLAEWRGQEANNPRFIGKNEGRSGERREMRRGFARSRRNPRPGRRPGGGHGDPRPRESGRPRSCRRQHEQSAIARADRRLREGRSPASRSLRCLLSSADSVNP